MAPRVTGVAAFDRFASRAAQRTSYNQSGLRADLQAAESPCKLLAAQPSIGVAAFDRFAAGAAQRTSYKQKRAERRPSAF
ncbi:Hypothetical predicted protein [Podarcis lilfordi]|uniref:Uncharacterized protein n=1 Tax=Podarcis lilfordi TaxID=74358 RepID=A0AA35P0E3_9SAUR|nr:Hypothetical predicted protein [Podarcis lilfordi]